MFDILEINEVLLCKEIIEINCNNEFQNVDIIINDKEILIITCEILVI